MSTNHNKRRINPGKVTCGPKGQIVRLEGQTAKLSTDLGHSSPVKSFSSTTLPTKPKNLFSLPIKPISLAAKFSDQQYQDLDDSYSGSKNCPNICMPFTKHNNPQYPLILALTYDYLLEWLSRKTEFLDMLLDMKAPPKPRRCSSCGGDGIYRCSDCFGQPLFCTLCTQNKHQMHPFHRISQWTGSFFEDSSLNLARFEVHLGHEGRSCPSQVPNKPDLNELPGSGPDEWIDTNEEYIPSNLQAPDHEDYLIIVDTTRIHYLTINYYQCPDSPLAYMQLFCNKLFPATLDQPQTVFTFHVLDDFIHDNLEYRTSGSNYFSKLHCITSNIFPHLVPVKLLRVSRIWRLLKLLKWKGFGHQNHKPKQGELALFCPSCPQPGINCNPTDEEVSSWKYMGAVLTSMCAKHMHDKQVNMDYSLAYAMQYNMKNIVYIINFYDINYRMLCLTWTFVHSRGWLGDEEIIETLWSMLNIVSPSAHGMSSSHRQELLDFQMNDSNFMKMIQMSQSLVRKYRNAVRASASALSTFNDLDGTVTQELHAQKNWIFNPSAMDIFDVQLQKVPTMQVVELDLLCSVAGGDSGLKLEEGQIAFAQERCKMGGGQADQLCRDISAFLTEARAYFGNEDTNICLLDDGGEEEVVEESANEEEVAKKDIDHEQPDQVILPLPSNLGLQRCQGLKMNHLIELELKLRIGHANDALHEIWLALANKDQLFRTQVRHADNYVKKIQAWSKVNSFDTTLELKVAVYWACRIALQNLGADNETLQKYKALEDADLKMKATASGGNKDTQSSCNNHLSWFWLLDVPRDTDRNDWMSEFYCDRWQEEVELLRAEFEWMTNFFQRTVEDWEHRSVRCQNKRLEGQTCYAARKSAIYVAWEKLNADQTRACSPLEEEVDPSIGFGLVLVKDLTKGKHCLAQLAFHSASRWLVDPGVPEGHDMVKFSQVLRSKQHERKICMVLCYGAWRLEAAAMFLHDSSPAEWPNDWHANWTLVINQYLYTQGLYSMLQPDKPPLIPSKLLQLGLLAEMMHNLLREQGWEGELFGIGILPNWQPISPRQPFSLLDPWWYENIPKIKYKKCWRRLLPYIDQVAEEALVFFQGMWTFDEPLPDEAVLVKGLLDGLRDFTDELAQNYLELQKVNQAMEEAWFVGLKIAGRQ
ncbi:hypothetical protein EV363DRAFT_1404642 [Boletus edulis]|nr:hypothetical protein EV363DRAFT_1404642 [Boletus edulis]